MPRFLGGRFLTGKFFTNLCKSPFQPFFDFLGFGTLCASASAKSFMAELAPPQSRGAYLGFLNSLLVSWPLLISQAQCLLISFYVGQITATGMMVSTGRWKGELSWRLPLWIQVTPNNISICVADS
jgi:hypothetical protein